MPERPLLTLAICCYKFERFIDEALDGAFDQTYRPLEIVVSDDCSPDGSWQHILDKVASRFPNAPLDRQADCQTLVLSNPSSTAIPTSQTPLDFLSLTLNRNPTNLGLARHENRLFELSHGEWIAFQAGDDISTSDRMTKIAAVVVECPQVKCLHSSVVVIDADGKVFDIPVPFKKQRRQKGDMLPSILGAGAVYHRDVYGKFGPLGPYVKNEDHVLPLRAVLIGEIRYIDEPLVRYRKHGGNLSGTYEITPELITYKHIEALDALYPCLDDLNRAEIDGLADFRIILKYRKRVQEELFLQWYMGNWRRHPESRGRLLWELVTSHRHLLYFVRRVWGRVFG